MAASSDRECGSKREAGKGESGAGSGRRARRGRLKGSTQVSESLDIRGKSRVCSNPVSGPGHCGGEGGVGLGRPPPTPPSVTPPTRIASAGPSNVRPRSRRMALSSVTLLRSGRRKSALATRGGSPPAPWLPLPSTPAPPVPTLESAHLSFRGALERSVCSRAQLAPGARAHRLPTMEVWKLRVQKGN